LSDERTREPGAPANPGRPITPAPRREERRPGEPHGSAPTADPVGPTAPRARPAHMPREFVTAKGSPREITIDGVSWVVYSSGGGAYGTGHWGLAPFEAIHFARADSGDTPELEALLPSQRLDDLFDAELVALFRTARAIVRPDPSAVLQQPRRFSLEDQ